MSKRKYNRYRTGDKAGRLTLVERMPGGQKWKCVCECGSVVITQISSGARACKKCAYKNNAESRTVHGEAPSHESPSTRLYRIWSGLRNRCNNPRNHSYPDYGGRGIGVCSEWDDYIVFKAWSLSHGYKKDLSIDRIDVNGNYEPSNCKWSTAAEQAKNTRTNHYITIGGITLCVMDWCRKIGIAKTNAYSRAKKQGMTIEEYLHKRWTHKNKPEMIDIPFVKQNGDT